MRPSAIAAAALALAGLSSAHADNVWTGATDSDFNIGSNYLGGTYTEWTDFVFDSNAVNGAMTVDLDQGWGNLSLNSGLATDIVIGGSNPILMAPANPYGWVVSSLGGTITIASDSKNLTIGNRVIVAGVLNMNVGAGRTITANGSIENWNLPGTASLNKLGEGTAVFTAANSYSGGTTIHAGTLELSGGGTLGSGAIFLTGGTLDLGGITQNLGGALNASGAGNGAVGTIIDGTLNLNGQNAFLQNGTFTMDLTGGGNSRLWIGGDAAATVELGGNNTSTYSDNNSTIIGYTPVTGAAGTVKLLSAAALGPANQKAQVHTGTLDLNGQTGVSVLQIALFGNGNLVNNNTSTAAGFAGTVDFTGVNTPGIGGAADITLSGVLQSGGFTKTGAGTLTLSGTSNTYNGVTTIAGGTLNVATYSDYGANGSLGNRTSEADAGGDIGILFRGGTLQYTGATAQSTNRAIRINADGGGGNTGGAFIDASGSVPGATLSFTATASPNLFEYYGNRALTLTGSNPGSNTFAMAITEAGVTSLVKSGTGKWVLTGTNTYSGTTTINAGMLQIGDGGTTGTLGSGPVTIASGASLTINRSDDYSPSAGQSISGAGALIKEGGGTLTLSGNSTHTGGTTINGGTLKAGANQAFGGSGATVTLNGGSIDLNGYSQTLSAVTGSASTSIQGGSGLTSMLTLGSGNTSSSFVGALTGNLALVKIGTGTLTLTGAVTMTGIITVQEGTLDLSAASLSAGVRINAAKLAVVKLPTASISKLYLDNVKLAPGRWGAPGSVAANLADFESPAFSGPGVVTIADTGISCMERWKTMKHGFFVHYVWDGYGGPLNADGTRPSSINETADRFDATGFANDMESMGVEYVIFTAWQANFFPLYNSSAMAKYHSGRTSNRDMIGDMITAVRAKGIRVLLYTHPYQPIKYLGTYPNQYPDLVEHNNLINDVHAELVDRYGGQIDGLFLDENFGGGNQDDYVDYARLLDTIRRRNPELVLMQNWGSWESSSIYTTDMMHREKVPEMQYRWPDLANNPYYSDTTPGPSTQLVAYDWAPLIAKVPTPTTTTAYRSAEGIFRTAVVGAGSCTLGGGWIWGAGPYAGNGYWPVGSQTFVGRWEPGVLEAMTGAAAYIAPVAASIKNTYPSTSWLTAPYTTIANLPQGIVATRSTDDTKEYIHVLNPPASGKTINLPLPADGKVFTNAKLLKFVLPATEGNPVTITRNTRGMSLTLGSSDNWETLDTVIVMDVASPGARSLMNNNDPSATYTGAWTYYGGRATTEYGQDVHETSTNGNYLEFTFNGTDIELIGTCASNRGTADVFIDGLSQGSINLYSATDTYRRTVFSMSGLARGAHTLKVVKTGGTFLTVDGFRVTEVINSDDPALSYSGNWSSKSSANAIGGEVRETSTNEDTMILNFEGNGIDVIGSKGVGGGNVRYKLNSSFELAVPQSSNFEQAQALIYTSINSQTLANGLHTLTGWKRHGTWADVDAFRIYKGTSTPSLRWGASGVGGNGTWNINNSTNWYDGSNNVKWLDFGGTDYSGIFGGTAGTVTLASNINVNRLTFQTTGYTVTANALNLTGPPAIITTPTGTTTINSVMAGTASLVKAGPGTLKLNSGTSTNSGNTTINEGTLSLTGTGKLYSNLGWQSRTVSVNNGTMLEVDRWDGGTCCLGQLDYSFGNLVINGGTIRYSGNSNGTPGEGKGFTIGANGATLQSDAPAGQTWNIYLDTRFSPAGYGISSNSGGMLNLTGTGNGLISKVIPGNGGLTKSGAGTWSLNNANTYTGNTAVNGGILSLGNGTSPTGLANTANVLVASGAKLNLNYTGTDVVNQLWLGGTRMPSGVYSSGNSSFITGGGTLTVNDVSASGSYTAWSGQFGYNLTGGPSGDDDNDGIANLLEYVLGGNPKAASSGILPTATASSGNLVFTFRRIQSSTADTTQLFQYGTNLSGWADVPVVAGGMVAILPNTPQAGTDTVTITVPAGLDPRIFGRLKVSTPSLQP